MHACMHACMQNSRQKAYACKAFRSLGAERFQILDTTYLPYNFLPVEQMRGADKSP